MSNIALSERSRWVGASESAALFGVSPYTTKFKLWCQKAGLIEPDDLNDIERVQAGQFLEPAIAAWAAHKWNLSIVKVAEYRVSPRIAGMGASLDYETTSGEPTEIKNVDYVEFKKKFDAEGDTIVDAPEHFLVQVQHQLACPRPGVAPADRGHLIVCVGGNRLYHMGIQRHATIIERLEEEVAEFWQSVEQDRPPPPDFEKDAVSIGKLYRGTGLEVVDLSSDPRAAELGAAYLEARDDENAAADRKKAALAEIKMKMQNARSAILGNGYTVSASHIKAAMVEAYERAEYWRFSVRQK